jgi:ABC-type nitrate/sulfonate/bicarbonate transport system substrate-binding protein
MRSSHIAENPPLTLANALTDIRLIHYLRLDASSRRGLHRIYNREDIMNKLLAVFSSLCFLFAAPLAHAQRKPQPVTVGYSSLAGTETALWVGKDTGLFEKYGLDVTLKRLSGSSLVVQAMLAREIALSQVGGTAVVDARLAGADLVYLASVIDTMVASINSLPSIKRIEDLRGKKLGVTRFGAITDFFGRYALKTKGLIADKDVGIVQTNDLPNTLASMKLGAIDAGVVVAPFTLEARKLGFPELVDMTKIGGPFPFNGVVATRDLLKRDTDLVRRFMKGYIEAISYSLKHKDDTMKIIGQYTRTSEPEVLEETYRVNVASAFRKVPYPSVEGFKTILDFVAETRDPKAKTIDAKSMMDTSIVKELDDSGFIKSLN